MRLGLTRTVGHPTHNYQFMLHLCISDFFFYLNRDNFTTSKDKTLSGQNYPQLNTHIISKNNYYRTKKLTIIHLV